MYNLCCIIDFPFLFNLMGPPQPYIHKYIKETATKFCSTCNACLCGRCSHSIHKISLMKSHTLVSVSERQHKCTVHPDQFVDLVTKDMVNTYQFRGEGIQCTSTDNIATFFPLYFIYLLKFIFFWVSSKSNTHMYIGMYLLQVCRRGQV
jgi:hypothetical protein